MAVRHVYDPRTRQRRRRLACLGVAALAAIGATAVAKGAASTDAAAGLTGTGPTASGSAATDPSTTPATGLDPGLVEAFQRAAAAAADAGHGLSITDGFRTAAEQEALFAAEVLERGSVEEASRWVFPADRSMHVRGLAVDVGDGPAADWLSVHGHRFGLCRTLSWEWWHFEWRAAWEAAGECPEPLQ